MRSIKSAKDLSRLGDKFSIFSYGSNGLWNLSKVLFKNQIESKTLTTEKAVKFLAKKSQAAKLEGHRRGFFGYSKEWDGSTATIVRSENNFVAGIITTICFRGLAYYIGNYKVDFLGLCENMDSGRYFLDRKVIKIWYNGNYLSSKAWMFVGNLKYNEQGPVGNHNGLYRPSEKYIRQVENMLLDRRFLMGNIDRSKPRINIYLC